MGLSISSSSELSDVLLVVVFGVVAEGIADFTFSRCACCLDVL